MADDLVISNNLPDVKLSTIRPDFADIRDQLNSVLSVSPVWRDILAVSTGEILIKFVAGVGAYDQYTIERGIQECFLDTARSPQNILTIMRMLGVRIARKTPGRVMVRLTREDATNPMSIVPFSDFGIRSARFYNPDTIAFMAGEFSIDVELVEGRATSHTFSSSGQPWQQFYVGNNFTSSNELVRVLIDGVEWNRISGGIWQALNPDVDGNLANQFSDLTAQGGAMEISFGNGAVGAIPPIGSQIQIIEYIIGGESSNFPSSNQPVSFIGNSQVSGFTLSPVYNASEEPSAFFYKAVGAKIGRSADRYVSRSDYNSNLILYPGVIDCRASGEWEEGTSLNLMNVINLYLLTSTEWTPAQEEQFLDFVYEKGMLGCRHRILFAQPMSIQVSGILRINPNYSVSDVLSRSNLAVTALLAARHGTIRRPVYRSDIHEAVMAVPGVEHLILTSPTIDYIPSFRQYVRLTNVTFTPQYEDTV